MKPFALIVSLILLIMVVGGSGLLAASTVNTPAASPASELVYVGVHDPAQLVRLEGQIVLFASAVEWSTYDAATNAWTLRGDDIYRGNPPSWYQGENAFWAPSIYQTSTGEYRLYHSAVENQDNHRSKIGFAVVRGPATNLTFEAQTDYVVESQNVQQPFAIDPAVFRDDDNRVWLVYGSHAAGIYMVELDEETGLLKDNPSDKTWQADDPRFINIANYGGDLTENNVEAAYIYNHPDTAYYYLFVNWDRCCNGLDSTYNIRVGRSTTPTGPFLDHDGVDLVAGGGTLFLDTRGDTLGNDRYHGPGHAGIYRHTDGNDYFSHHFYNRDANGEASFAVWRLTWEDDWPVIDPAAQVNLGHQAMVYLPLILVTESRAVTPTATTVSSTSTPLPTSTVTVGNLRITAIGDSIMAFHREAGASIADVIGQQLGVSVVNNAVGGAYLTNDIDPEVTELDIRAQYTTNQTWDWLVMDGGGNDFNDECGCGECAATMDDIISADGQSGALPTFVDSVTASGTQVIFMGYYDIPDTAQFGFDRCEAVFTTYKQRVLTLVNANPQLWFVDAGRVVSPTDLTDYVDDHVHPSIQGSQKIGVLIADTIRMIVTQ